MAKLTRAEFIVQIDTLLASARDPRISAADLKTIANDLLDTLAFATLENAGEGLSSTEQTAFRIRISAQSILLLVTQAAAIAGVSNIARLWSASRVRAAIQGYVTGRFAALTGATFTGAVKGIDPVANNDLATKAYIDAAIATAIAAIPGGLPVGDHFRYLLLTETAAVPNAATFLASVYRFDSDRIVVPAHDEPRYYQVAEIYDNITGITQEGTQENARLRWTAMADLPQREIGGDTHYIYSTLAAQFAVPQAIPVIFSR